MISLDVVREIKELVPMPASASRLVALANDPDADLWELARVVELDQALTANALRMANSAWSGSARKITTVREALVRLGTARVLGLAVAQHVVQRLSQRCDGYELAEHELWRHSVAAALASENLGHFVRRPVPPSAFTAALVHDIGKLLLARQISSEVLDQIRRMIAEEHMTHLEAERKVLETDHAEVGGAVARHWQFPEEIATAIEQHHEPDARPTVVLDIVHIANAVAKLIGVGLGSDQMNMKLSSDAHRRLGITRPVLEGLCARVTDELGKTEEFYGSRGNETRRTRR